MDNEPIKRQHRCKRYDADQRGIDETLRGYYIFEAQQIVADPELQSLRAERDDPSYLASKQEQDYNPIQGLRTLSSIASAMTCDAKPAPASA